MGDFNLFCSKWYSNHYLLPKISVGQDILITSTSLLPLTDNVPSLTLMIRCGYMGCVALDAIISLETQEVFLMATYPILIPGLHRTLITDHYKDVDPPFTSVVLIAFWALL